MDVTNQNIESDVLNWMILKKVIFDIRYECLFFVHDMNLYRN